MPSVEPRSSASRGACSPTPTSDLTRGDEERLITELLHDTFDLGPITPLLLDEEISDILVNTHRQVYVERLGRLELTPISFRDEAHLRLIIDRIISQVGRRVDELADGRRAAARRIARERDHPAAGHRRAVPVDPPVLAGSADRSTTCSGFGALTPQMLAVPAAASTRA